MKKLILTHGEIQVAAQQVAELIVSDAKYLTKRKIYLYGVPRGGIPAALAVAAALGKYEREGVLVEYPSNADFIIDDLIDSGATESRMRGHFPSKGFCALFVKRLMAGGDKWIVFPWESADEDASATDVPIRLLQYIGFTIHLQIKNVTGLLTQNKILVCLWQKISDGNYKY